MVLIMQMSADTKDVFIEVTATDLTKARIVLATLATMFSEHCSTPFEIEPVETLDALGLLHGERRLFITVHAVNKVCQLIACHTLSAWPPPC